jgi:outer membrane immunogenic protein
MKRLIVAVLAGLSLGAGIVPVFAADMPSKASPFTNSADGWTGFYLGASVGAGFGSNQFQTSSQAAGSALKSDTNIHSWIGGFQLGYNYQINRIVIGAEGNFDWAGFNKTSQCNSGSSYQFCSANPEWFATFVERIGGVFGSALLYVDGGAAWTHEAVMNLFSSGTYLGSQIRPGWTVGAGIEYQLSHNWSVKFEYDYMNFGNRQIALVDAVGSGFTENIKQTTQLVKAGFNYRFNGSGVPVDKDDDDPAGTLQAIASESVGKKSVDASVAGIFALTGTLDTSGPRLYLSGGAGRYQFGGPDALVTGIYSTGGVLGGYGFVGTNYDVNLFAGVSVENDLLSVVDASDPVHGTAYGIAVHADASINPTPKSVLEGEAEFTTAFNAYNTTAKFGYDVFGKGFFIGPQVGALGDSRFRQWRAGVDISSLKLGKFDLEFSAGYANDSSVGPGAYSEIGLSTDF